jgi:hypothetical protein
MRVCAFPDPDFWMDKDRALVPAPASPPAARTLDANALIEGWQKGRSAHTVRAYGRDLAH